MAWDDITQYSWLHPRRSPAENLALGAQTGATIRSAWTQRHADTRAAQMLPFQMYAAEQQARAAAYEVDSAMRKMQEEGSLNAGLSELSKITASIAETGNWESPESRRKIRELGIKYPKMTITQPYLAALGQTEVSRMERLKLMHEMANIEATGALAEFRRTAGDRAEDTQEAIRKRQLELEEARQKGRKEVEEERTKRSLDKEKMEQEFEREMSQLDNETKLTIAQIRSDLRGGVRKQMAQVDFIAQLAPKIVAASFGRKTMKEAEDEALSIYKRHSPLLEEDAVLGTRAPRTGTTNSPTATEPRRIKVIRIDENGNEQRGTVSESSLAEALRQGYRIAE